MASRRLPVDLIRNWDASSDCRGSSVWDPIRVTEVQGAGIADGSDPVHGLQEPASPGSLPGPCDPTAGDRDVSIDDRPARSRDPASEREVFERVKSVGLDDIWSKSLETTDEGAQGGAFDLAVDGGLKTCTGD